MHARGLTLVRNEADFSFAVEQLVLGLVEVTLTAFSLVQGFLNWETEARMGRQRTELRGPGL